MMINSELYQAGCDEYYDKYEAKIFCENDDRNEAEAISAEKIEELAWSTIYNDMYKVDSVALGYYVVAEEYGIDEANKYLLEMIEIGRYNVVRVA